MIDTKSNDWLELKEILTEEFTLKPLSIKTDKLSAEQIAIEVRASQIASERIKKFIGKIQAKDKRKALQESWK